MWEEGGGREKGCKEGGWARCQLPLCAETGRKTDNLVLDGLDDRNCSRKEVRKLSG